MGKIKVIIEYENYKIFTIISTTIFCNIDFNLGKETVVTVEENINSNDLISPSLNSQSEIKGNLPIVESYLIDPKRYQCNFEKHLQLSGCFLFSTINFPLTYFNHLILTEKSSSINFINYEYDRNITINTKEDIDAVFI